MWAPHSNLPSRGLVRLATTCEPLPEGHSTQPSGPIDRHVEDLLEAAGNGFVRLDLLFGAYHGDRLISAAVAIESTGAAAMVSAPQSLCDAYQASATLKVLLAVQQAAWQRSNRLLEALVAPGHEALSRALEAAGFRYLTELIYLTSRSLRCRAVPRAVADLTWLTYGPRHEPIFQAALEQSYLESLDCPELTGIRTAAEVLATHRAKAHHDPALWWVAMRGAAPVGIALTNRVGTDPGIEIVYLGVAQPSRGTGVADALLARVRDAAGAVSAKYVTLAVDRRNTPARKMYARWSFTPVLTRRAYVATCL